MTRFTHFKLLCFKPNMQLIKRSRNAIIRESNKARDWDGGFISSSSGRCLCLSSPDRKRHARRFTLCAAWNDSHTKQRRASCWAAVFHCGGLEKYLQPPPHPPPLPHNSDAGSVCVITPASNEGVQRDLPHTGVQQSCVLDSHRCSRTPDPPLHSPVQPFLLVFHYFAFYMKDSWRLMSKRFFLSGLSRGAVSTPKGTIRSNI